jgi:hypothetical protein
MNHNIIRNRFNRSPLPPNREIAEALRHGDTTLDDLAAEHGVSPKTIAKRLYVAGWDPRGSVIPTWRLERPSDRRICARCGREQQVKKSDTADMRLDCRQVEQDIARLKEAVA